MKKEINKINKEIGQLKKNDKEADVSSQMNNRQKVEEQMEQTKEQEHCLIQKIKEKMRKVGNLVHPSVPVSKDEKDSEVVSTWGEVPALKVNSTKGHCHHHEVLAMIDGYDPKRGQKIAGHRGFFLKGYAAMLNMAL